MQKKPLQVKFNNLRIQQKITLLLTTLSVVIFCIVAVSLAKAAEQSENSKWFTSASEIVSYSELIVEKEQQYLYGAATYYAMTPELQQLILQGNESAPESPITLDSMTDSFSSQNVLNIVIYNKYGNPIGYQTIDNSYGPVVQNPENESRPFYALMNRGTLYVWEYINQGSDLLFAQDNSPKVCLWYAIRDIHSRVPIGAMAITLDSRKLYPMDKNEIATSIYLVDSEKMLVLARSASDNGLVTNNLDTLVDLIQPYQNSGSISDFSLEGKKYDIAYSKIPDTSFYVFYVVKDTPFQWNRDSLTRSILISIFFILCFVVPTLLIIHAFLTRPLNKLIVSMEKYRSGEHVEALKFRYQDEIGIIGNTFDEIIRENSILEKKNYLLTIRGQAAELAKLQAQINPHFIYNTLNTIQWTAIDKGDEEIAELIYAVGQVFRLSLNHGNDFVTIAQEQKLLSFYLGLQQKRFEDRLSYRVDIDPELLDIQIPKLLIQPLVENASVHGAKDSYTTVHISVCVRQCAPKRMEILVTDDGAGIAPEILKLLPDKLTEQNAKKLSSHFALRNISKRLALYYGEDYRFTIDSVLGEGTSVRIEIPFEHLV